MDKKESGSTFDKKGNLIFFKDEVARAYMAAHGGGVIASEETCRSIVDELI